MDAIKIIIKEEIETTKDIKSKLFGSFNISLKNLRAVKNNLFLLAQINLSDLPHNDLLPKEGLLYFFVSEDGNQGKVIYSSKLDDLAIVQNSTNFKSFSLIFKRMNYPDGLMMLGKPLELNKEFSDDEVLLLQYDPYEDNQLEFLNSLDGVIYFAIKKQDLLKRRLKKAFIVKDFT